jgi:DNA repair photolyase
MQNKFLINEINADKVLGLTKISLADYVINHYVGCQYGCLYCYAKYTKRAKKRNIEWGTYVDVKINSVELLKKELEKNRPETVMLGSITEVYQPIEKKYELTRKILEILAEYEIPVVILTRSDLIKRDIDILKKLPKVSVFYTITFRDDDMIKLFENYAPGYKKRVDAITELYQNGINVWVHMGPIIPYFSEPEKVIEDLNTKIKKIEFESLNVTTAPLNKVVEKLKVIDFEKSNKLLSLYNNKSDYDEYWTQLQLRLEKLTHQKHLKNHFAFLPINDYF